MSIEAMKLALFALDIVKIHYTQNRHINEAIAALKERLADPMREVQRLGQEIEQEPICPDCKAKVLYECVACSSNNYPPQRTEQEPVELPCCGYTDASAVKWNPFNGVVQCHNCGQCYTTPPQRTEPVSDDIASILACRDMLDAQPVPEFDRVIWPERTWVGLTDDDDIDWEEGGNLKDLVKAIEAKLKQKNGYAKEKNAICSPFMISELWRLQK